MQKYQLMYFSTIHVRDYRPCYHCTQYHAVLSNHNQCFKYKREHTYMHSQSHAHMHLYTFMHIFITTYAHKTERLCVSASIGISSACQLQSQP